MQGKQNKITPWIVHSVNSTLHKQWQKIPKGKVYQQVPAWSPLSLISI